VADDPLKDVAEVEIVCPHCGYRMMRTAARLRRPHRIDCPACGKNIVPGGDRRDGGTSSH
jgi:DNA-directed RNA polymerase subunit RPC12/RpoP